MVCCVVRSLTDAMDGTTMLHGGRHDDACDGGRDDDADDADDAAGAGAHFA